ncbi:MAG: type II toxin-antitoxin system RelE/ParE family toxin [Sphingomonas sp.]
MNANYTLLPGAEADLRDIVRYTRQQWGSAQTRSYVAKLQRSIEAVAGDKARPKICQRSIRACG